MKTDIIQGVRKEGNSIVYPCGCVLSRSNKKRCSTAKKLYKNGRFKTFKEMTLYWQHFTDQEK